MNFMGGWNFPNIGAGLQVMFILALIGITAIISALGVASWVFVISHLKWI